MTFELQNTLIKDLSRFGLNPQDWEIIELDNRLYQLAHREEEDFSLLAYRAIKHPSQWQSIELFTL